VESLLERISNRSAVIGIIGIGYVGLPLAISLSGKKLFQVVGIDVSHSVVDALESGKTTVEGVDAKQIATVLGKSLRLVVVSEREPADSSPSILEQLEGIDVFIICVPTPLSRTNESEPDTGKIEQSRNLIARVCEIEQQRGHLPKERLIILESTTYPGTTQKYFKPLLEKYGIDERRWYLAYAPERTSPGAHATTKRQATEALKSKDKEIYPPTSTVTRIIGALDQASSDVAQALYETVFSSVQTVANLETAEMTKLVENTFRSTSIAFANEMARIAKTLGLNIWDIIDAAKTKGFGFDLCYPGLIGGHCLPIDPHYLGWATRNRRLAATFVDVAESEHQNMRREAFDLIQRLLNQQMMGIAGSSILFFGVSYKKDVGDIRESAAIKLMENLFAYGAKVSFWDPVRAKHPAKPHVRLMYTKARYQELPENIETNLRWDDQKERYYIEPDEITGDWKDVKRRVLSGKFNCLVLATDHKDFGLAYPELATSRKAPPIADLCNAVRWWMRKTKLSENDKKEIDQRLGDRRRYMLLGLH